MQGLFGSMTIRRWWTLALAWLLMFPALASAERVALVVGNSAYDGAARLVNPGHDASDIAQALETAGFDVRLVLDADRHVFHNAISSFRQVADHAELAVFFFAGHGLQAGDHNYFVPTGTALEATLPVSDLIALEQVLDAMSGADNRVVILDACRNNPFSAPTQSVPSASTAGRDAGMRTRGLAGVDVNRGMGHRPTLLAFATAPGSVAEDGPDGNSPFSSALKRYIGVPGIDVREVFTSVREKVLKDTNGRQVPWDNSSLTGAVYFVDPSTGILDISVRRPEAAQIFVNGQLKGEGAAVVRGVPAGQVSLRIQAPGYLTHESSVQVRAGAREEISLSLRREVAAAGNVLQQLNQNRPWCCDGAGNKVCLMPSGGRTDIPCRCPGRDFVGQICK